MQYLNDDNLDELFRRAANDYPLNTDSSAWDKVSAGVQKEEESAHSTNQKANKRHYRKYLWLLLLLPMTWICKNRLFMTDSKEIEGISSSQKTVPAHPALTSKATTAALAEKQTPKRANQRPAQPLVEPAAAQSTVRQSTSRKDSYLSVVPGAPRKSSVNKEKKPRNGTEDQNIPSLTSRTYPQDPNSTALTNRKNSTAGTSEPAVNREAGALSNKSPDKDNAMAGGLEEIKPDSSLREGTGKTAGKNTDNIKPLQQVGNTGSMAKKYGVASAGPNPLSKKRSNFLYVGVIGSLDVSTVEFQSVKNTGYNAGVLIGYQLNKRLAFETGLYVDKKFYYTDGKYFSTKNLYVQPGVQILDANGDCYMFDLPLNLKYNWSSTQKSQWFSTLGLSTYFMKNEKYDYSVEDWGQDTTIASSYKNSSTTWFGQINLSAGYLHTLGKVGSLRIEPYLKIPMHGLGVGNLSIWSSGIYVSFIKTLF